MGLDMYLKRLKDLKSIEWATAHEKDKDKYEREVIITFKDGEKKQTRAYCLYSLYLVSNDKISIWNIKDITKDKILIEVFNENAQEGEERTLPMEIPFALIKSIPYEHAYWRKANQIHAWFVNNIQDGKDDCGTYEVTGEQLLKLVELCKEVLKKRTQEISESTLPTQVGFFFGSYGYDDGYYEDIENTINQLKDVKPTDNFSYTSSW